MQTAGVGTIKVTVWPTHVGLGTINPTTGLIEEPDSDPDYCRGQITWNQVPDGDPEGHGTVHVPTGRKIIYTHLIYAQGPVGALSVSEIKRLKHPMQSASEFVHIAGITKMTVEDKIL